jgi:hypothetical protein
MGTPDPRVREGLILLPDIYVTRMEVPEHFRAEFTAWYNTRHGPDAVDLDKYSAHSYHSVVGAPWICNLYEVPGTEVLGTPKYTERHEADDLLPKVMENIQGHSATIYRQVATANIPDRARDDPSRPSLAGAISAPAISTLRLEVAESSVDEFLDWYQAKEFPRLSSRAGFLRARLARVNGFHPWHPSDEPEWIAITEWAAMQDAVGSDEPENVIDRHDDRFGDAVSRLAYTVGTHQFTLLNPSLWGP